MINTSEIPLSKPLRIIIGAGEQRWQGANFHQLHHMSVRLVSMTGKPQPILPIY
jgi:hypothetical protein